MGQVVDEKTKQRWIKNLMEDYPELDHMMAESAVELWIENPDYVDKLAEGKEEIEAPKERNTNYSYEGCTVAENTEEK